MKLTKKIKKENCFAHDIGLLIKCDNWEQMEQQILQNQKLRELVEEKIKEKLMILDTYTSKDKYYLDIEREISELQQLLESNHGQ